MIAEQVARRHDMEIGGESPIGRIWRTLGWGLLLLVVCVAFAFLFYHFTSNLRIALIVVTGMLLYMILMAFLAEGRIESRNRE